MIFFESINKLFEYEQYCLTQKEKEQILTPYFEYLYNHHKNKCDIYKILLDTLYPHFNTKKLGSFENMPFIPVQIFKDIELLSISKNHIFKTMLSSGTSGNNLSKIFLDKQTSRMQSKVLANILSNFLGNQRLPMLVIDSPELVNNRNYFSVRKAATLGFSIFAKDIIFALDQDMNLDHTALNKFSEICSKQKTLVFGFTNIIWKSLLEPLINQKINLNFENSTIIHGGGWKKLEDRKITNKKFKYTLLEHNNISRVFNYYGMVEQTGSVYMECEKGFLHCSNFSDILIRDSKDFSICPNKKQGLVQVLSVLPYSYPGQSLITEDIGAIYGVDNCECGRLGMYFKIFGRIPKAEVRGCSDAY